MKKNLVLTGMMGVGKSTIGVNVAKKLGLKFIDVDQVIEIKEKRFIRDIFKNRGESYFRKIEKKITFEQLKKKNSIISLGGGAFINPAIRKEVKNSCISFWLDLKVKSLFERLKNVKKRPLLDGADYEEAVNKIYSERKKFYNESNFRIKCDAMNKDQIADKIIKLYENTGNKV